LTFFVKELIILTPRGVYLPTTIPVTDSCTSHIHLIVLNNYVSKIKRQLIMIQVSAQQWILNEIIIYWTWFIRPNPGVQGSKILPRPGIEPQSHSSQSDALTVRPQRPPQCYPVWEMLYPSNKLHSSSHKLSLHSSHIPLQQ